jgi:myo-inositol 2-dehydrogenase/D-chiro-inositol 1-dehydrogenase
VHFVAVLDDTPFDLSLADAAEATRVRPSMPTHQPMER